MATLTGNDGVISIDSVNVANVRNFSIEMKADTIETSVMGQDYRTYVTGMNSFSGSADVYFEPSDFDTNEAVFNPTAGSGNMLVGKSGVTGKFYLAKDSQGTTTDYLLQGSIIITGYNIKSSMDGLVEASISFQGTGSAGIAFSTGTAL
jgi:hypothetical protein